MTDMSKRGEEAAAREASRPADVAASNTGAQSLVDRRFAAAEAAGLLANLPGAGKPLQLDDDSLTPEDARLAHRLLKGAGFAPPWIELRKLIMQEQAALASWLGRANALWRERGPAERRRLADEYRQRIAALNKLIESYNLGAPPAVDRLPLLEVARELGRLGGV
jgi:hypothetical protein